METTTTAIPGHRPPRSAPPSAASLILLAIALGLCAGYLDIGILVFKRYFWNSEGYFRSASDFPWTVPLGHALLMLAVGVMVAAVGRRWPRLISLRAASWLFATLAIWFALLRMPLYAACSLLLAAGTGRVIADAVAAHAPEWCPRRTRWSFGALLLVLGLLAAASSGWQAVREYRSLAGLPAAPPNPRNVVLIVWDTVRAYNLSLYGYGRSTTPNLEEWARKGVRYDLAVSPAPWTFPSHACFFTGQWPHRLNSQWNLKLDAPVPTLAEYLTTRGYQTAGFVANTNCCSYETGLNRGFAHFVDYALTPRSILTRTVPGKWVLDHLVSFYDKKWIALQSRDGGEITDDFLRWLNRRRPDRPFFAFLNYFDAHEPYIPASNFSRSFGIPPRTAHDYQFLIDYIGLDKNKATDRDVLMARDCYDDCIAALDAQLGRLLEFLQAQRLLENTEVIITSDHGEAFGIHGIMGHSYSVYLEETGVPLVVLSPDAPAGRVVKHPVSLRDLPATVLDLLGLSASSPFPGRSLAAYWKPPHADAQDLTSPAFSERASEIAFHSQHANDRKHDGVQMSVAALGYHYVRTGNGLEQLFNLKVDPYERNNLAEPASDQAKAKVTVFRKRLLDILTSQPGSPEVERAYLATYRSWLRELVQTQPTPSLAARPESTAIGEKLATERAAVTAAESRRRDQNFGMARRQ